MSLGRSSSGQLARVHGDCRSRGSQLLSYGNLDPGRSLAGRGHLVADLQSWVLTLFFQVCSRSFFTHGSLFLYRSFCGFSGSIAQSLSKRAVVRSEKERQNARYLLKLQRFALLKIRGLPPRPPPTQVNYICMYSVCKKCRQAGRGRGGSTVHTTYATEAENRNDEHRPLLCVIFN